MCGIAGSFGFSNEKILHRMLNTLHHRGPDDTGYFLDKICMLGIKRLSILDPKLGKQPMSLEKDSVTIVFNGEIFNYVELKKELIKKNCVFKTNSSDTEVILQGYKTFGLSFIEKLNGMFAIAIFDKIKKKLFLARDRSGIKPLFYTKIDNNFYFASEIKSFFNIPFFKKEPNMQSIDLYFSLKNIPNPYTSFKNVFQLPPGYILIIDETGEKMKKYWDFKKKEKFLKYENNIKNRIQNCLENSVKKQLRSDVEVGCFLSGGLDSSAITVIASKLYKKKLKTFSVVYENQIKSKNLDTNLSRKLSKEIKSDHYEFLMNYGELEKDLNNAIIAFDQPFAGALTSYFLSKEVSKHVKVALTGDGADELFGSYIFPRIVEGKEAWKGTYYKKKFKEKSIDYKNEITNYSNLIHKNLSEIKDDHLSFKNELKQKLINSNNTENQNLKYLNNILKNYSSEKDLINLALKIDFKTLLADQVLSFVDILSMQSSLEIRPPFLDNEMINLAFKIEGTKKIKYSNQKVILKKAMKKYLGDEYIYRKKEGFVIPVEDMYLKKNIKYVQKLLDKKNIGDHNLFNHQHLNEMIKNIPNNNFYENNRIWILYCFQVWWNKHFN